MSITLTDSDRVNAIKLLKPLATFEKLKETADGYRWCDYTEDEYVWMEKLYNDPSLAPLVKKKKK